ncbi:MAG: hypothetical protein ACRD2Z_10785 [Thermoanaerobaculia bacterium]
MNVQAWILFLLVAGFVWGGFLTCLILGLRREAAKARGSQR